jgi:hypothetical protein
MLRDAAEKASMNALEVIQRAGKQTSRKCPAVLGFGICEKLVAPTIQAIPFRELNSFHCSGVEVKLRPSQSASTSRCRAPIWDPRPFFLSLRNFL